VTLADLLPDSPARIARVVPFDTLSERLMEMGLVAGAEVMVISPSRLGSPMQIRVRGYKLSLRRQEAQRVELAS
jgi:Fe2+ transport system protein FeoA